MNSQKVIVQITKLKFNPQEILRFLALYEEMVKLLGMLESNPSILQTRSDAFALGVESAFKSGLPPQNLIYLEQRYLRHHQDMQRVFLRINKPAATGLDQVFHAYRASEVDYLPFLPLVSTPDIDIRYNLARFNLWNLKDVREIMTRLAIPGDERTERLVKDPEDPRFGNFLNFITSEMANYGGLKILLGVLVGIPEEDAKIFDGLRNSFKTTIDTRWNEASKEGLKIDFLRPKNITYLCKDEELRKRYFVYASTLSEDIRNPQRFAEVDHYISVARFADVPGFRYLTFEPVGSEIEEQIREAYEVSGIQQKIESLLTPYKKNQIISVPKTA